MTAPVLTLTSTHSRKAFRIGSLDLGAALRITASSVCVVLLSGSSAERMAAAAPAPAVVESMASVAHSFLSGVAATAATGSAFPIVMIGATAVVGALGGALGALAFNRRERRYERRYAGGRSR